MPSFPSSNQVQTHVPTTSKAYTLLRTLLIGSRPINELASAEWQDLLRFRLGLPIMTPGPCAACARPREGFGDHALSCASCGRYARHNALREVLADELRKAGFLVTSEEQVPLTEPPDRPPGPSPSLPAFRPADLLVHSFKAGKPLAIDVTVTHPLRTSCAALASGLSPSVDASRAESAKVEKYSEACSRAGWLFMPFALETTGGWGPKARRLIQILASAQASRLGSPVTMICKNICGRLRAAVVGMCAASFGRCTTTVLPSC